MIEQLTANLEERVLVLTPTGRDAALAREVLERAHIACHCCSNLDELCDELTLGAATLVLAEEVLFAESMGRLESWIGSQPPWSDLPVLLLAHPGAESTALPQVIQRFVNVTVLERPTRIAALISAIRTALRSRQWQYRTRQHLSHIDDLLNSERAARISAEQAGRLKDDFLATVSHELRTPLNGILGWAQLLKRGNTDPDSVAEGVGAIERGARMQAQLIDDLLDMNRIVTGRLRLELQDTELIPVIEAAIETVRPSAEARKVGLVKALGLSGALVRADPARLQQVVWNLLTNAVKFTPAGGTVRVSLLRTESHLQIEVTDSGQGISPEFLPHVFERFRQADSSTMRRHGGLGLGLAIVKHIVELHGGTVAVSSEGHGKGASFQVRLPVVARNAPYRGSPAPAIDSCADVDFKGFRILVVDDDPVACEFMRRMLTDCNASVETVASGQAALDRVSKSTPDLILCDIGMPGLDGIEVIRKIRRVGIVAPAIAVTAFARAEDRVRALQAGYNMHVSKPVDANELLVVVETLLRTASPKVESQ